MNMEMILLIGGAVMLVLHGVSILLHLSSNAQVKAVGDALDTIRKDASGVGVKEPSA